MGLRLSEGLGSAGGIVGKAAVPPLRPCMAAPTCDEQVGFIVMDSGALTSSDWFEIAEMAAY